MKTRLSLFCIAITMLLSFNIANAQHFGRLGNGIGGQQSAFQAVSGDLLQPGLPGRLWFEANFADQGLGYDGSYLTLGGKTRLFEDFLDGRWLLQGQVNHSIEDNGGLFVNIGVERVFSVAPANADISFGLFYDYDGDDQQTFSNGFHQIGVSGVIKMPRVDLIGNGYIPIGTRNYTLADITGGTPFVGNNIATQAGIESALQGFDLTLRTRPKQLAFANGFVDFGAYHYDSDIVDPFAGGRLRVGFQLINGIQLAAEVNHDERFDTTGALSVALNFGANNNGRGSEYAGLARDLEKFSRNDHIVRFSQDLVVAINPLTGQPFNVIHANNTQLGVGDGTAESPFATLAEAEAASSVDDVIFVDVGDGTSTGYQSGITLQDRQQLVSGGGTQFVQNADGTLVSVTVDGATAATISNPGGNAVVTLADNNVIAGITVDALGANYGVFGSGINGGTFNQTTISDASLDGIGVENVSGNWSFTGNSIATNFQDGIFINGSTDPTSVFNFENNVLDTNVFDGIHLANYDAASVILNGNQTNNSGRHGVFLENAVDSNGDGTDILVTSHFADANGGNGVFIDGGDGLISVLGSTFSNNAAAGLAIRNWQTFGEDVISIAALPDGTQNTFTGNTVAANFELDGPGLSQTVSVTGATLDGNGRGLVATANGVGTELNLSVGGTTQIINGANEAVAHLAEGGATINSLIEGTPADPLDFLGNSIDGGPTLSFAADGSDPMNRSEINAVVRNVNVDNQVVLPNTASFPGAALSVDGQGESRIDLLVEDSSLLSPSIGVLIALDNVIGGEINRTYFDNVDIRGNFGIVGASEAGTLWDLSVTNSIIRSAGIISDNSAAFNELAPQLYGPFTDLSGDTGILVTADGGGLPGSLVSDNFTRVTLQSNTVEDFTFDGIVLQSFGDAQLFSTISSNQILRNGPGFDEDGQSDDGVVNLIIAVTPDRGEFHDGIDVTAFDDSTITLDISNNFFVNNFQRSLNLTTQGNGQINAAVSGNRFSSDVGIDPTLFSFDFFTGEVGVQNFGGEICLGLSANTFRSVPLDIVNLGAAMDVSIGLDGLTNGFPSTDLVGVFTPSSFGLCESLVEAEETSFETVGGFTPVDH